LALEQAVVENKLTKIPEVRIHTTNGAARKRMEQALESIQLKVEEYRIEEENQENNGKERSD